MTQLCPLPGQEPDFPNDFWRESVRVVLGWAAVGSGGMSPERRLEIRDYAFELQSSGLKQDQLALFI
ncbi:hypothetical protein EF849_23240, partial [Aeromonas jandaei]|nr:hypothetical protein [Aeromonas jandaei]